jgi:hypothetical protein
VPTVLRMPLCTCVQVVERVRLKCMTFGQDIAAPGSPSPPAGGANGGSPKLKVSPEVVARVYEEWVMPLTKEVEVQVCDCGWWWVMTWRVRCCTQQACLQGSGMGSWCARGREGCACTRAQMLNDLHPVWPPTCTLQYLLKRLDHLEGPTAQQAQQQSSSASVSSKQGL